MQLVMYIKERKRVCRVTAYMEQMSHICYGVVDHWGIPPPKKKNNKKKKKKKKERKKKEKKERKKSDNFSPASIK